ncbi:MAG: glycoside hydrolase family protein [Magnetococcales bacterium]|nr:glycoside hydrolase family protein [Magnetococcales bacterium]
MDWEALKKQIKQHEGMALKPYKDTVGKTTIGYGRNLEDVGITLEEAEHMLDNDLDRVHTALQTNFVYFNTLNDVRQRVLMDMCFNIGLVGLKNFRNMHNAIRQKDYVQAAAAMLNSKWATQVGQRAKTLANMMKSGKNE